MSQEMAAKTKTQMIPARRTKGCIEASRVVHRSTLDAGFLVGESRCRFGAGFVENGAGAPSIAGTAGSEGLNLRHAEDAVVDAKVVDLSGETLQVEVSAQLECRGRERAAGVGHAVDEHAIDVERESRAGLAHQGDGRPGVHRNGTAHGCIETRAVVVPDLECESIVHRLEAREV